MSFIIETREQQLEAALLGLLKHAALVCRVCDDKGRGQAAFEGAKRTAQELVGFDCRARDLAEMGLPLTLGDALRAQIAK